VPNRRVCLLAAAAILGLLASGCGGSGKPGPKTTQVAATGLTVSVLQWRTDYTVRRAQIEVSNGSSAPVKVTAARLTSTAFAGTATWQSRNQADETTIGPGVATDLPAPLPPTNCQATGTFRTTVQLSLRTGNGIAHTAELPVQDKFGTVAGVHADDCRRQAALDIAALTLVDPLRRITRHGRPVGLLDLRVTPSGKPGTLSLESIGSTTLLGPPTGAQWTLNRTVSATSGPSTVTLELRAARCDPHAIAEDKLGTVMPLTLHVNQGPSGVVTLPADPDLRIQIQRFVRDACAAA
jgi:hypothetical protein